MSIAKRYGGALPHQLARIFFPVSWKYEYHTKINLRYRKSILQPSLDYLPNGYICDP
jgi:hypothetical protein